MVVWYRGKPGEGMVPYLLCKGDGGMVWLVVWGLLFMLCNSLHYSYISEGGNDRVHKYLLAFATL